MTYNRKKVTVEEIMDKLRSAIARSKPDHSPAPISEKTKSPDAHQERALSDLSSIRSAIGVAEENANIGSEVSPMLQFKGLLRKAALLVGKAVVFLSSFMTFKQRNFNNAVIFGLRSIADFLDRDLENIKQLQREQEKVNFTLREVGEHLYAPCHFNYSLFESKYHSEPYVRAQQSIYIDYFKGRSNIVDLGCGRGEFLDLLHENGLDALGVDANPEFIAEISAKGHKGIVADILEWLKEYETCLDAVFCCQVVEHLTLERIQEMLRLIRTRMRSKGLVVIETMNPVCPEALSDFWLDPTHVRPIHPQYLEFAAEQAGFDIFGYRVSLPSSHEFEFSCGVDKVDKTFFRNYYNYAILLLTK